MRALASPLAVARDARRRRRETTSRRPRSRALERPRVDARAREDDDAFVVDVSSTARDAFAFELASTRNGAEEDEEESWEEYLERRHAATALETEAGRGTTDAMSGEREDMWGWTREPERVVVCGVGGKNRSYEGAGEFDLEDSLDELERLTGTAGCRVVGRLDAEVTARAGAVDVSGEREDWRVARDVWIASRHARGRG